MSCDRRPSTACLHGPRHTPPRWCDEAPDVSVLVWWEIFSIVLTQARCQVADVFRRSGVAWDVLRTCVLGHAWTHGRGTGLAEVQGAAAEAQRKPIRGRTGLVSENTTERWWNDGPYGPGPAKIRHLLTREDVDRMDARGTAGSCICKPKKRGKNCAKRRTTPSYVCFKGTPSTRGFGKWSCVVVLRLPSVDKRLPICCRTGKDMHMPEI